jgi:hypothetical protein
LDPHKTQPANRKPEQVPENAKNFLPGSVSINDEISENPEKEELPEVFDTGSEEFKNAQPIDKDQLEKVWKELAMSISVDQPDLGSTLASRQPEIAEDFKVQFEVTNAIQKDKLDSQRAEIVPIIREKLQNRFINLEVIVRPEKIENLKPATPAEKFIRLAQKNAVVKDLQKKFGLEPNY